MYNSSATNNESNGVPNWLAPPWDTNGAGDGSGAAESMTPAKDELEDSSEVTTKSVEKEKRPNLRTAFEIGRRTLWLTSTGSMIALFGGAFAASDAELAQQLLHYGYVSMGLSTLAGAGQAHEWLSGFWSQSNQNTLSEKQLGVALEASRIVELEPPYIEDGTE